RYISEFTEKVALAGNVGIFAAALVQHPDLTVAAADFREAGLQRAMQYAMVRRVTLGQLRFQCPGDRLETVDIGVIHTAKMLEPSPIDDAFRPGIRIRTG